MPPRPPRATALLAPRQTPRLTHPSPCLCSPRLTYTTKNPTSICCGRPSPSPPPRTSTTIDLPRPRLDSPLGVIPNPYRHASNLYDHNSILDSVQASPRVRAILRPHRSASAGLIGYLCHVDDVEGIDALRWNDQEKIRNYVGAATSTASSTFAISDKCTIEVAQSARASCRRRGEKITKEKVRVSAKLEGQGWYHVSCFLEISPSASVEKFPGWEALLPDDKGSVLDLVKKDASIKEQKTSKGSKRKNGDNDMHDHKAPKLDESITEDASRNKGKLTVSCDTNTCSADLHKKLKEQSPMLWKLKG